MRTHTINFKRLVWVSTFMLLGSLLFFSGASFALDYDVDTGCAVPIPPAERNLTTETAKHFKKINNQGYGLEGIIFAKNGDIYFCEGVTNKVLSIDKEGNLATVAEFGDFMPAGLGFHPDGRLIVSGIMDNLTKGAIYSMLPDGSKRELILAPEAGFIPNDLAINSKGGIYFTDFKGNMTDHAGGVYYIEPDTNKVIQLIANLANANGIALSPNEKVLWVGDYGRSILYRVDLEGETHFDRIHSTPVYYFTGRGPDAIRVDSDGNVYVAIMSQGRALVFNPKGLPIGQILIPGRENGENLYTSSLTLNPDSRDIFIVARDDKGLGSSIFKANAFASGVAPK